VAGNFIVGARALAASVEPSALSGGVRYPSGKTKRVCIVSLSMEIRKLARDTCC
jgi:hypothetical protein